VSDDRKRAAAEAALREVEPGMRLGLGSGSTAWQFVDLLGAKVAAGLDCICVPTSERTARQAEGLGIRLAEFDEFPELDLTVDGADEIGPDLALIKGGGGALLREKIVAAASRRMVVIADDSKLVPEFGRFPLPIEVNRFGLIPTKQAVETVFEAFSGTDSVNLRRKADGEPFITDGGHLILDACFGRISAPEALSQALLDIPGVVQHGLFLNLCQSAYVAGPDGVTVLGRETSWESTR
jgi:ribose 5-phosphate isomerase A